MSDEIEFLKHEIEQLRHLWHLAEEMRRRDVEALTHEVERWRMAYEQLLDPIVRAKMLEPGPPVYVLGSTTMECSHCGTLSSEVHHRLDCPWLRNVNGGRVDADRE